VQPTMPHTQDNMNQHLKTKCNVEQPEQLT
jgi:hypothetical protein